VPVQRLSDGNCGAVSQRPDPVAELRQDQRRIITWVGPWGEREGRTDGPRGYAVRGKYGDLRISPISPKSDLKYNLTDCSPEED